MNPDVWGPHAWFYFHTYTFNYPFKPTVYQQECARTFFNSLECTLPCKYCRENYKRHLGHHPIEDHLKDRKTLVYWLIDLHNMINNDKKKRQYSYGDAIKIYEKAYKKKIPLTEEEHIEHHSESLWSHMFVENRLVTIGFALLVFFLAVYKLRKHKVLKF